MPKKRLSYPYLYQRGNLYGFRWTCSPRLSACIGRKELRRSLKTGYRAKAVYTSMNIVARIKSIELILEGIDMRELQTVNLHVVLDHYFHTSIMESENWRTHSAELTPELTPANVAGELAALEYLAKDTAERLRFHRSDEPPENMREVAEDAGFEAPPPNSPMARELARGILLTDARLVEVELRRTNGDYRESVHSTLPVASPPAFLGAGAKRLSEERKLGAGTLPQVSLKAQQKLEKATKGKIRGP